MRPTVSPGRSGSPASRRHKRHKDDRPGRRRSGPSSGWCRNGQGLRNDAPVSVTRRRPRGRSGREACGNTGHRHSDGAHSTADHGQLLWLVPGLAVSPPRPTASNGKSLARFRARHQPARVKSAGQRCLEFLRRVFFTQTCVALICFLRVFLTRTGSPFARKRFGYAAKPARDIIDRDEYR